jgi:hypothetical protein
VPPGAPPVALRVSVLVVAVAGGLKDAVMPAGNPVRLRVTLLLNPLTPVTVSASAPVLEGPNVSNGDALVSWNEGSPETPVRSSIRCWPAGVPHPVDKSYPVTAGKPPLLPVLISFRSEV